jgi:hypothetical protein
MKQRPSFPAIGTTSEFSQILFLLCSQPPEYLSPNVSSRFAHFLRRELARDSLADFCKQRGATLTVKALDRKDRTVTEAKRSDLR